MKKSFSYRIYPNKKQEVLLNRTLDTCRYTYNNALAERIKQSNLNRLNRSFDVNPWGHPEWINYYDQVENIKTEFQEELHSQVLQNTLKRVERSFKNMFKGAGYPRFQGRNRYNSFTYPQAGYSLVDGKLKLSKIGSIKIILHRPIEGKIKTCTIKKDIDQWYVSFSCDIDVPIIPIESKTSIGIDVGLISLLTLSDRTKILPPKFLRQSEARLTREQIHLSKKKLRSKNRNKQRIKVAKVHRTIRNQRKDFNQKLSRTLVNTYDTIAFEDLQIQNMLKNHHLAKSISDSGWYNLQQITSYKAEWAGKTVKFCNPHRTSMTCNICGNIQKLTLADRTFECSECGNIEDRDINASINIKNRCNTVGTTGIKACLSNLNREAMTQEAPML
jgi:putative transposase